MRCLRRVQKLEAWTKTVVANDPLRVIRKQAFDRLAHSDRKVISELAYRYQLCEEVEETVEIRKTLARWGALVSVLASQPREPEEWL